MYHFVFLRTLCPLPQSAAPLPPASSRKSLELRTTILIQTRSRYLTTEQICVNHNIAKPSCHIQNIVKRHDAVILNFSV